MSGDYNDNIDLSDISIRNQVAGTHYQTKIQPIDYIQANDLSYCEGNVVKYISRHERKNGEEDIMKAIHYCLFILKDNYGKELNVKGLEV